ncbi:MAG: 4-hydroxy-tetrahydrodipicolinate synthase [Myxococcota bacterium]|jgi:4-hydroxy-tetrahydrodipicolinate synthase
MPLDLLVANVTPFTPDGRVDLPALTAHTAWMASCGVDGFAPTGTTGGFLYLSADEKRAIHRTVIEAASACRVCPCVWDPSLAVAVELARQAESDGAWAVFLPPPIYHVVRPEVTLRWYDRVRAAVSLPVLAYHHPSTLNPLTEGLIARLLSEVGLDGLKDSSGQPERIRSLSMRWPGKVWIGGDGFLGQAPTLGPIAGHISGLANGWPAEAIALRDGGGDADWLATTRAALKAGGGTAVSIQAALSLGHRLPLDGVGSLDAIPRSSFRRPAAGQ